MQVHRRGGQVAALEVHGHALSAPYGQDLVCAAVSAVVQTALLGLGTFEPSAAPAGISEGDVHWQGTCGPAGAAILETCILGLRDIAKMYPAALAVKEEEL